MASYLIDTYQVRVYTSRSTTDLNPERSDVVVFVFHGNTYRGALRFYPDGTQLKQGSHDEQNGRVTVHLNNSQFGDVIDTLRHEKPLYLFGNDNYQFIHTGQEPIGEEETG